MPGFILALLNK